MGKFMQHRDPGAAEVGVSTPSRSNVEAGEQRLVLQQANVKKPHGQQESPAQGLEEFET